MKKITLLASFLFSVLGYSQTVVINELDCDTTFEGNNIDNHEFIELLSSVPNFALDGYVLVLFNGSTSGGDSSYFALDLDGYTTDINGLLLIGSSNVSPFPQVTIPTNLIQNGADAVALYLGDDTDFLEGTLATQTNLVDVLVYDTSDANDTGLMALLGASEQINEGSSNNTNSIQRFDDGLANANSITYVSTTPTPRALNDGSGVVLNGVFTTITAGFFNEGDAFDVTFTTEQNVTTDLTIDFTLDNYGFNTSDFTGSTTLVIPAGQNTVTTTITIIDDAFDEGDEVLKLVVTNLPTTFIALNNNLTTRVVDNDFVVAPFGTPLNSTFGIVSGTQPSGYYDSLDGLSDADLQQALQDIVANPALVRGQTYRDVITILEEADQNPENSNQVWLVYKEEGKPKLDFQTTSDNTGKWNREHTFPRSLAGYNSIDLDDVGDGKDVWWATTADSLRHGNSDAHALRAADGPENSNRSNQHYGQYNGPSGTLGSFKGDVARSVLYMQIRYNGLSIENGYPTTSGQMGDLQTLLDWHRNDPPDDFEMNRNNVIYEWQINRNPFIDQPDLVEYIWGDQVGNIWNQSLSVAGFTTETIKVYPNPVLDKLYISGNKPSYEVTVFSAEGRAVLTQTISNNSFIDLKLASGLYMVTIEAEGERLIKKILIN
ncbi:endonuclease [Olleya namhaensis]|uniref:Por secretion system C-terminal sorting domain-containing protein n=1 Tax=Olleya namhaensis TaxID=1144750 RepID=A0A1I3PUJ5_9FLAO|nr:endonuclease [Olleya namhaensis]SFJ25318.1 Por secretion system C-terminal sorting domain-containing protein [Olleya namhaensis]